MLKQGGLLWSSLSAWPVLHVQESDMRQRGEESRRSLCQPQRAPRAPSYLTHSDTPAFLPPSQGSLLPPL